MKSKHLVGVFAAVLVAASADPARTETEAPQTSAAPPLSLEGLLGDEERLSEAVQQRGELKADNFACLVCHGNFEEEKLVVAHAKHHVGCIKCHGDSVKHADDEDHIVPPDEMYDREDVDAMCGKCHPKHIAPARQVIARWQQRCAPGVDAQQIVCTDCHFHHRMKARTVWWNRKTGDLVIRKTGQTTKPADPPTVTTEPDQ